MAANHDTVAGIPAFIAGPTQPPTVQMEHTATTTTTTPSLTHFSGVSVAVDPVALVVTECITVTSAMRKHARWAHSSVTGILGGRALLEGAANLGPSNDLLKRFGSSGAQSTDRRSPAPGFWSENSGSNAHDSGAWSLRPKKTKPVTENPLMGAFIKLRGDLKGCRGMF